MKRTYSLVFASILALGLLQGSSALAYTGAYGIVGAPIGGPEHITVENFDFETNAENNYTDTVVMGLTYVQSMTITTSGPVHQHILIKEYPAGSDQTFDVIVPQPVQDALVSATVYIWAPDTENLSVRHDHQGVPTVYETATKVEPKMTDQNGNVLWSFTVSSFSSFDYLKTPSAKQGSWNFATIGAWFLLIWVAILAPAALRKN